MRKTITTIIFGSFFGISALAFATSGTSHSATPQIGWGYSKLVDAGEAMTVVNEAAAGYAGAEIGLIFGGPLGGLAGAIGGAL